VPGKSSLPIAPSDQSIELGGPDLDDSELACDEKPV
jgi:hypothetical protein